MESKKLTKEYLSNVMFVVAIVLYFIMPKYYDNSFYFLSIGLVAIVISISTDKSIIKGIVFIFVISFICFISIPFLFNDVKSFPFYIPNEVSRVFLGMINSFAVYVIALLCIKNINKI